MNKNLMGRTRPQENPYLIFTAPGFEWRVLKAYQSPAKETANPYARWFCATKGPGTFGGFDLGDAYVGDIVRHARLTFMDPDLKASGYTVPNPPEQDAWL